MAVSTYMWLKDDGGADIKVSVNIQERKNLIECFCRVAKSKLCHHYLFTTQNILITSLCRVLS